jgi:hypothetical protein
MVDTKTILLPLVLRMIFAAIALRIDRTRAHDTRAGMKCVTIDNVTVQVVCNTCCGNLWTREKGCPDECWDTFVKCAFCEQRGAPLGGLKISLSAEAQLFSCLACLFPTPAPQLEKSGILIYRIASTLRLYVQLWNASTLKIGKSSVKGHTRISN